MENGKVVLVMGVIGADVHAVGNKILDYAFNQAGFKVINLGVMVSQKEFVEAAIEANADCIVVSSLYGHGEIDCPGLKDKCNEAGLDKVRLYVGGNLVVGKQDPKEVEKRFLNMGFDRVYAQNTDVDITIADIKKDFKIN